MTMRSKVLAGVLPYGFLSPLTRHAPRVALALDDGNGGAGDPASGAAGGGDGAGGNSGVGAGGSEGTGGVPGEQGSAGEGKSLLAGAAEGKSGEGEQGEGGKQGEGEGGKPAGKEAKPAPADTPKDVDGQPVPEAYDIKAPDGMEIDKELLARVTPGFREAKLSPKQAQTVADAYTEMQKGQIEAHQKTVEKWTTDAKNDPEIGRAGLNENLGHAKRALDTFGTPGLVQVIDQNGLGNHPEMLRVFVRMGKAIGEGGTVLPGSGVGRKSDAEVLFPSMNK